jgi:asparagine synthase (glutamine-hydrolysing)
MCGICGVYQYQADRPLDDSRFGAMLASIHHRGPDDQGVYLDGGLALGMRRLSIIDLAGGKQPIWNEDGSVVVLFNGEIYNYIELTRQLEQRGHRFATSSDTETIVHLYEEEGDRCVESLRGMFGFALWDERRQRLLIARDRLGIKPLYYSEVNGTLVFGSEIKSILQHPGVTPRLDLEALNNYLALRYTPAPQTLFTGIRSLPPGHLLIASEQGVAVRPYWDLEFTDQSAPSQSEATYTEALAALLDEVMDLHLRSDVPFGAFLSGGVDSSLIVALMAQRLNEPVKTFSVGFAQAAGEGDELPYARLVAQQFQTDHHEILVQPRDFTDLAATVIWHLDQPIADQATVATYLLAQLAGQHVKMVLTGEGGDELFAGYARYAAEQWSPWFRAAPGFARELALAASSHLPGMRRAKLALYALCQPEESNRFLHWFPLFNQAAQAELTTSYLQGAQNGHSARALYAQHLAQTNARNAMNRMLYVDTKLWLPDYLLLRGDKLTMAASIEGRVPLLDHKLVEFAASLPPQFKLKGAVRKYLLKQVGRRWLPDTIIDRKKAGFPIPIAAWFRNEARSFLHDLLSPTLIRRRGLFDEQFVQGLLGEHDRGFADHSPLLWGLASIELWQQLFLDQASAWSKSLPRGEKEVI